MNNKYQKLLQLMGIVGRPKKHIKLGVDEMINQAKERYWQKKKR